MATYETHVAELGLFQVNSLTGEVIPPGSPLPIKGLASFSTEFRLIEDSEIPNTIGHPTIKEYLRREAEDDFEFRYIDQTNVVTEKEV